MAGGRPTDYNPKFCAMLIKYFSVKPYKKGPRGGDKASDFPSFAGFACLIGSHRETILNWVDKHPEFFDAYKKAKELQENWMIVNGNKGIINPMFAMFTAKNVLNWRDKHPDEADQINIHLTLADRMAKARARTKK